MIEYGCVQTAGRKTSRWTGSLKLKRNIHPYEMEVSARGSYFHIIFGRHAYGNFLCIPNWDVGCELVDYSDTFWNTECLSKQLKKVDAISVAQALAAVKQYLK
ncbi:MAG: DUF6618 family protein [Clostridiaceae bacterium]